MYIYIKVCRISLSSLPSPINMVKLYDHPLFRIRAEELPVDDRIRLSYQRAKLAATSYGLSLLFESVFTSLLFSYQV